MRSLVKLRRLYLYYHNVYDHKTCLDGDIQQGAPIHRFSWLLQWIALKKSRDKLNILYLLFQEIHERQSRQGADLVGM